MSFVPSNYGNANREDFYAQLMLTTFRPGSGYGNEHVARPNVFPIGVLTAGIQTAGSLVAGGIGAAQQGSQLQHQNQLANLSAEIERERLAAEERAAAGKRRLVYVGIGATAGLGVLTLLVLARRRS